MGIQHWLANKSKGIKASALAAEMKERLDFFLKLDEETINHVLDEFIILHDSALERTENMTPEGIEQTGRLMRKEASIEINCNIKYSHWFIGCWMEALGMDCKPAFEELERLIFERAMDVRERGVARKRLFEESEFDDGVVPESGPSELSAELMDEILAGYKSCERVAQLAVKIVTKSILDLRAELPWMRAANSELILGDAFARGYIMGAIFFCCESKALGAELVPSVIGESLLNILGNETDRDHFIALAAGSVSNLDHEGRMAVMKRLEASEVTDGLTVHFVARILNRLTESSPLEVGWASFLADPES